MKKSYFIMLMALMCIFSCRTENTSDTLSDQTHKSKFDASFKEVLQATKSPDESSLMAKVQDFTEDYNPSDFIMDTAKIKKTLKNGEVTEYAIYLKKKNETEIGVFYNLVFTKKIDSWKKYLVKFTPAIIPETNNKIGYKCEFISKKAQASKCGSSFYMTEYFQCWAGHTDSNDGDCNGCWRLGSYGIANTCDEEAPDDFNGAGDNYGGGVTPNVDGLIHVYADPSHWALYNSLSAENKFKCYQALLLSSDTSYVNFSIDFFSSNPTVTIQQFLNWFMYDIHITTDMDARVKCILQKMAGDTNISDDKITLPITPASDNLFQKMLRMFNGNNAPKLTFKYDPNLPATGAYASTKSYDGGASYEIVLGADILQSSNIRIMTILAHELTHAFMLNDLTQLNMIEWYNDGTAHISTGNAQNACNQNDFFSNNPDHYFANLLCLYMTNSPSSLNQWQHEIFETPTFDINSYIQKLTNYVKNNHDWNSESASWTSSMQTYYGNNWKYEVALNLQMDGIRQTSHFASWSNKTPTQFHNEIVSIIDNGHLPNTNNSYPANKNCN
ncbi:hypothetical protein [Chryseobacterium sp. VD8]|uniref:hypothetical protein n=1 Tax=Chryseobacterium sp. VD8 TaxID=3081254 RepID=UPI003017A3E4